VHEFKLNKLMTLLYTSAWVGFYVSPPLDLTVATPSPYQISAQHNQGTYYFDFETVRSQGREKSEPNFIGTRLCQLGCGTVRSDRQRRLNQFRNPGPSTFVKQAARTTIQSQNVQPQARHNTRIKLACEGFTGRSAEGNYAKYRCG
jgi:hypothetical protein